MNFHLYRLPDGFSISIGRSGRWGVSDPLDWRSSRSEPEEIGMHLRRGSRRRRRRCSSSEETGKVTPGALAGSSSDDCGKVRRRCGVGGGTGTGGGATAATIASAPVSSAIQASDSRLTSDGSSATTGVTAGRDSAVAGGATGSVSAAGGCVTGSTIGVSAEPKCSNKSQYSS